MSRTAQPSISRILTSWLLALAVVLAPLAVRRAQADSPRDQARKHYQAGRDLYARGEYQAAIREFQTANKLEPSPVLDFNIGLAYERLDDLDEALAHYKAYVSAMPGAANRAEVEAKIQTLEAELGARKRATEVAEPYGADPVASDATPGPSDSVTAAPDPAASSATVYNSTTSAATSMSPPSAPVYEPTGDPQLDRAAAVDMAQIREQRVAYLGASAPPDARGAAPIGDSGTTKKAKPVYKQWWFWVVVGVSTVILIDMATGDSSNATSGSGSPPPPRTPALIHF